jgi:hypothetical protein
MICQVEKKILTVGEKTQLTCQLDASLPANTTLHFEYTNLKEPFDIKFLGAPVVTEKSVAQTITSYKIGELNISGVRLIAPNQTIDVAPFSMNLKSVLPPKAAAAENTETAEPTPFPIYDPVSVPVPWWWWGMWAILLAAVSGFVIYHFLRWKKERDRSRSQLSEEKFQTPAEKFRARIRKLESSGLHDKGDFKSFALELTQILKSGLGSQLGFPAEDQTSEEIIENLERKYKPFYKRAGTQVKNVLSELDQIKFAKTETTSQACLALLDQTAKIGQIIFEGVL